MFEVKDLLTENQIMRNELQRSTDDLKIIGKSAHGLFRFQKLITTFKNCAPDRFKVPALRRRWPKLTVPDFSGPRITSYNVCYTKLLRTAKHRRIDPCIQHLFVVPALVEF